MCLGPRIYTPALHTKNVPLSTLLHAYKTTKKCIFFFKVLGALNGVSVKDSCVCRFLFGKQVIMWN